MKIESKIECRFCQVLSGIFYLFGFIWYVLGLLALLKNNLSISFFMWLCATGLAVIGELIWCSRFHKN